MKKFLLLSSVLMLSTANVAFAQEEDNSKRIVEIEAQITELEAELKELIGNNAGEVIGETFQHSGIEVTINDVYLAEERNEYEEKDYENVLTIEYTVMNNLDEEFYAGNDFALYVGDRKADHYFLLEDKSDVVSAGRSIDVKQSFGFNGEANDLELEFSNPYSYSAEKPIIIPLDDLKVR